MHKNFGEFRTCSSEDMIAGGHRQTDTLITILRSPTGGGVISVSELADLDGSPGYNSVCRL